MAFLHLIVGVFIQQVPLVAGVTLDNSVDLSGDLEQVHDGSRNSGGMRPVDCDADDCDEPEPIAPLDPSAPTPAWTPDCSGVDSAACGGPVNAEWQCAWPNGTVLVNGTEEEEDCGAASPCPPTGSIFCVGPVPTSAGHCRRNQGPDCPQDENDDATSPADGDDSTDPCSTAGDEFQWYRGPHNTLDNHLDIIGAGGRPGSGLPDRACCVKRETVSRSALKLGEACHHNANTESTCNSLYELKYRGDHRPGKNQETGADWEDPSSLVAEIHVCTWMPIMQQCDTGRRVRVCPEVETAAHYGLSGARDYPVQVSDEKAGDAGRDLRESGYAALHGSHNAQFLPDLGGHTDTEALWGYGAPAALH